MPVESISNYNGDELARLVARIEADGGTVKQVIPCGSTWTVLFEAKKKPGPKPKVETR